MPATRRPRKRLTRKQLRARRRRRKKILRFLVFAAMAILLFLILFFIIRGISSLVSSHSKNNSEAKLAVESNDQSATLPEGQESTDGAEGSGEDSEGEEGEEAQEEAEPVVRTLDREAPPFNPHSIESTAPSKWIATTDVIDANGYVYSGAAGYTSTRDIQFGLPEDYSHVEGVIGFRGDNFRNDPTFGNAEIKDGKMKDKWTAYTSALQYKNAYWSGSGWTGQPLIVKWPESVKKHMNLKESAKAKEDLVEVIYACMDGYVYFLDLETG